MLPARLIEFIDTYADTLTRHAVRDLSTSWRTRSFDLVPASELEARVFATYCRVASWIAEPSDDTVREDYERWGAARFRQGIPLSEIVYALFLLKHNLRRSLRDHEVLAAADDRASAQELDYVVDEFFDRAMYHLARGYEREARTLERRELTACPSR